MYDKSSAQSPFLEETARSHDAAWRGELAIITDTPSAWPMQRAAELHGLRCEAITPSALVSASTITAAVLWAVIDDAEADWLEILCRRQAEEHFPLILEATIQTLDAVYSVAQRFPDCSIVVTPTEAEAMAAVASQLRHAQATVHASLDTVRDRQIESLQEEVQRISRMLARLAMEPETQREPPSPFIDDHVSAKARSYHAGPKSDYDGPTVSSRDVRQVIRQRRLRDELFDSELFADPAWDMLLDLYAARLDRSRVSVSSLCIAAAVPATTALRWIKTLTETGLFERKADQHDARRIFVQLSDEATTAMHRYFARLSDPRLAV